MKANPILLEVFKNRLSSIAEEMGVTLQRTSFSPNIKERRDYSCAIFDARGDLVAQAAHIPVHLGSMPLSVKAALSIPMEDGDMVVLNDPFQGGTHLPDITLVAPVFIEGQGPRFYVANRAHHADVGGMAPGSMPLSTSIFQEGFIFPPIKLVEKGEIDTKVLSLFLANVRTPQEREGDFSAQIMANITGIKRLRELVANQGLETVSFYCQELMAYTERITRETIRAVPDGTYTFRDFMEDDGTGSGPIPIEVSLTVRGDQALLDFSNSSPQVKGSINSVYAITLSAVLYAFRCLMEEDVPVNAGITKPIKVITPKGSIVDANFPAAVAGGNVETSQRVVDVVLGALASALPHRIPAASQGTMNNLAMGGIHPATGQPFAYYETLGGGTGAWARGPGVSGVHSHMTNTLNTPIEALEYTYPLMVTRYCLRRGSGGKGLHRGGDGLIRELEALTETEVTVLSERRKIPPYGLAGGEPGKPGKNLILRRDGAILEMPGKFHERLEPGDRIRIETPGGGGWGKKTGRG